MFVLKYTKRNFDSFERLVDLSLVVLQLGNVGERVEEAIDLCDIFFCMLRCSSNIIL